MSLRLFCLSCVLVLGAACSARQATAPGAAPAPTPAPVSAANPAPDKAGAPPADPARAMALLEQGRAQMREHGDDGAEPATKIYREALAADPACAAAYWELGWSLQTSGHFDEAVAAWQKLKALAPAYPELEARLPVLLMRRDQAAVLAALPDPGVLPPRETSPRAGPMISIAAVGDVQMGRAWPADKASVPPNDARDFFHDVKADLFPADVTFGNLETALLDTGDSYKCSPTSTHCFSFRAPTVFAYALADAGFDAMSIANNHAGDFGPEGRASTIAALDALDIHHSGPLGDIASWQVKGLRIALVAFAFGSDMYSVLDIPTARKIVADLKRRHDLVFVSFHAGAEGTDAVHLPKGPERFLGEDRGDERAFAHAMVDAGADLLLGSGPHVMRAMEIYQGRLIAYSMGNFSGWNSLVLTGPLGISAITRLTLAPNGVLLQAQLVPTYLDKPGVPRPDPERRAIDLVRKLSSDDLGTTFFDKDGHYQYAPPQPLAFLNNGELG